MLLFTDKKKKAESYDHILIHCDVANAMWHLLFSLFGVACVLPSTVKGLLLSWKGSFVGEKRKKCGEQPLFVSFGRFSGVGIVELLTTRKNYVLD